MIKIFGCRRSNAQLFFKLKKCSKPKLPEIKPESFEKKPLEKMEEQCPGYSLMNMIAEMFTGKK